MGPLSSKHSIEDDYSSVNELLAAAKFGKWKQVWEVLGTPEEPLKKIFLNSIPTERRWSVLHQAVYWKNKEAIEILLKFDTCDTKVKAKHGTCEVGPAGGKTPSDVAEEFKYTELVTLLKGHTCKLWSQKVPTFHTDNHIKHDGGFGLFCITMAAYKDVFHPAVITKPWNINELMNNVFIYIDTKDNWKFVRDKVSQSLFPVSKSASSALIKCQNKDDFFRTMIEVYTSEHHQIYKAVNIALRRQKLPDYMPLADDLAFGPYILMFNMLLMHWKGVKEETRTTYRLMGLTEDDSNLYTPETIFLWISISSSSLEKDKAMNFLPHGTGVTPMLFKIDNRTESHWRPRNIENLSDYGFEHERVYPAGSRFKVVSRGSVGGITEVQLQLLAPPTHEDHIKGGKLADYLMD